MYLSLFLKSIIVGFAVAAPVGPVGILCMQRTLSGGKRMGLSSGFGAALADTLYGVVAGLGISVIVDFLFKYMDILRFGGGLLLCALGLRMILRPSVASTEAETGPGHFGSVTSTFLLTLSNPVTITAFLVIFTSIGLHGLTDDPLSAVFLAGGLFAGSMLWWCLLTFGASAFRRLLRDRILDVINRVAGAVVFLIGVAACITVFFVR